MNSLIEGFSGVVSLGAFGNISKNEKVIKELYRILRPNGKIIIQSSYIKKIVKVMS